MTEQDFYFAPDEPLSGEDVAVLSMAERRDLEIRIERMRAANDGLRTEIGTFADEIALRRSEVERLTAELQRLAALAEPGGDADAVAEEHGTEELEQQVAHLRARVRALEKLAESYQRTQAELRLRLVRLEPGRGTTAAPSGTFGHEGHAR